MRKRNLVAVIFLVLYAASWVLVFWACSPSVFGGTDSPLCPLVEEITGYLTLIAILSLVIFVISKVADDSSARDREAKRQIVLEAPHVLMPPEEEQSVSGDED